MGNGESQATISDNHISDKACGSVKKIISMVQYKTMKAKSATETDLFEQKNQSPHSEAKKLSSESGTEILNLNGNFEILFSPKFSIHII